MIKKVLTLTLVLCMAVALFAGCGQTAAPAETTAPKAEVAPQEEAQPPAAEEKVTLTIMSAAQTEQNADVEKAIADAYMQANPNVTIEFIPVASNEISKKIVQMNMAENLPDAFIMSSAIMPVANDMDILVDHSQYVTEEFTKGLSEAVYKASMIGDKMCQIPWFTIPMALIYRTDWLEEADMTTIETMDDFTAAAKAFTKDGRWGFSMVGTNNASGQSRFIQYARAFGVDEVYKDENGKWASGLTSDKYKQALQSFVDLDLAYHTVPAGAAEAGYPEASNYFAQEQTGLMLTGSNAIGVILSTNPALDGKIGSVPVPMQERHSTDINAQGYAITTACKHPEVMADYLMFMTEKENAIMWGTASGRMPVTTEAAAAPEFTDVKYKGFSDAVQYANFPSEFPAMNEIWDIAGESYNSMLGGGVSIDDAMARVEQRVADLMAEHNK